MASSSSTSAPPQGMAERSNHHQQPPLQCPRCNSSNTKFCYYNNYSLSQPRHFCKACKRYWTRGGTLRNVPVGGGCRRNKRLKRPPMPSGRDGALPPAAQTPPPNPRTSNPSPPSNRTINNPLIYRLDPLNFPFSSLSSARVCGENPGFDFQPEASGFGLGFSSGLVNPPSYGSTLSPFPSSTGHTSVLFGPSAFGPSSTMPSQLASTFPPQKFGPNGSFKDVIGEAADCATDSTPYEVAHSLSRHEDGVTGATGNNKDVKVEGENGFGFGFGNSEPSLLWSTTHLGAWFDPTNSNMGSSVSPLI